MKQFRRKGCCYHVMCSKRVRCTPNLTHLANVSTHARKTVDCETPALRRGSRRQELCSSLTLTEATWKL